MIPDAQRRSLGLLLSLCLLMSVIGAIWPVWQYGGGSVSAHLTHLELSKQHDDQAAADLMSRELYGEPVVTREPHAVNEETIRAGIERIYLTEKIGAILILAAAVLIPIVAARRPALGAILAIIVATGLLVEAGCAALNGGKAFSELAVPAHAVRWCTPIILALLMLAKPLADRALKSLALIACSLTFFIHGWEAWHINPPFVDQLCLSLQNVGFHVGDTWIRGGLKAIGLMDGLLAVALLSRRWPMVPAWMALWGLATAIGRIWAFGWIQWHEAAMRASNFALPLFVLFLWLSERRSHQLQTHNP